MPKNGTNRITRLIDQGHACNICGAVFERTARLREHLGQAHGLEHQAYRDLFYGLASEVVTDGWDDSEVDHDGHPVVMHVLVRKFVDRSRTVGRPRCACPDCSPESELI